MRPFLNRLKGPAVVLVSVVAIVTPSGDPVTLLIYALPIVAAYAAGLLLHGRLAAQ